MHCGCKNVCIKVYIYFLKSHNLVLIIFCPDKNNPKNVNYSGGVINSFG